MSVAALIPLLGSVGLDPATATHSSMRVAALIPLLGCVWNFALAFFVLTRAPRAVQNRVYFFLGLFISIWNLGQFFNFTTTDRDAADFWVRFVGSA